MVGLKVYRWSIYGMEVVDFKICYKNKTPTIEKVSIAGVFNFLKEIFNLISVTLIQPSNTGL